MELIEVVAVANTLGEGVTWDHRSGLLWWTDIQEQKLHRLHWSSQSLEVFDLPDRLASFGLTNDEDRLITAFADGFYLFSPETGERVLISLIETENPLTRMNDGRLDRRGCFWAGSMVEQPFAGASADGALYRIEAGEVTRLMDGIRISNGLAFSSDGNTVYFADSPGGRILQFSLGTETGALSEGRDFARSADGTVPDGAIIDSEDCYWSAQWGNGQVLRYTPGGEVDQAIQTPAPHVSCVEFGGPDQDLLFVTSAKEGLDENQLSKHPQSGDLFVYQTQYKGIVTDKFYPVDQEDIQHIN